MKVIDNPNLESEQALDSLLEKNTSTVKVRGKEWKVGWLYKGTMRKVTSIMLSKAIKLEGIGDKEYHPDEDKIICKCAAALRLNGLWSIKFFYWYLWRYYYYIKQYRDDELLPFILECKKKVDVENYAMNIISLTAMRDTTMTMTRAEVERFQAAHLLAQHGQSAKKDQTS